MFSVFRRAAIVAVVMVASATGAEAQRFGGQVNWGSDSDLGVGARAEFDLAGKLTQTGPFSKAFIIGAFDYYFMNCDPYDCSFYEINPSLAIPVGPPERNIYVGAGLNLAFQTFDYGFGSASASSTGINLLGGMKFPLGNLSAFTEARFSLGGSEQLALSFGLLFGGPTP